MAYERKKPTQVTFPFLNEPVFIRSMKAAEKWDLEQRCPRDPDTGRFVNPGQMLAEMVAASVVDAMGKPIFSMADLQSMDEDDLTVLWQAVDASRICGDADAKKKVWQTVPSSHSA